MVCATSPSKTMVSRPARRERAAERIEAHSASFKEEGWVSLSSSSATAWPQRVWSKSWPSARSAGTPVVVIGGGLLGLEAAHGLAKAGAQVSVLHLMDRLMERQLDAPAARMLKRAVEVRGIAVRLNADAARIIGDRRVEAVELRNGGTMEADAVVVSVGIRANTELARTAGLKVDRGIAVDDHLETSVEGIHAIGECAEHRGLCYGLVEPAYEQAQVLARRLAGESATYRGSVPAANLKVAGVQVFSAGDFLAATADAE